MSASSTGLRYCLPCSLLLSLMCLSISLVILGTHLLTGVDAWELLRNVSARIGGVFLGGYACFGLVAMMAAAHAAAGTAGLIAFAVPLLLARQMFLHWKRLGGANDAIERKDKALSIVASRVPMSDVTSALPLPLVSTMRFSLLCTKSI